jgi:DNA-binding transcriptional regulator YiaG
MKTADAVKLARARELAANGEGERIRVKSRLSHAHFGAVLGVSDVTILRWERGDRKPSGKPALRYVDLLDKLAERRRDP